MRVHNVTLILMLIPITLFAATSTQQIKASLINQVSYIYDEKEILEDSKLIMYEDRAYIPLSVVKQLINKEIYYSDSVITIKEKEVPKESKQTQKLKRIEYAIIKEIDEDKEEMVILAQKDIGSESTKLKCSILEDTQVIDVQTKTIVSKKDLQKGMVIAIECKEKSGLLKTSKIEAIRIAVLTQKLEEKKQQSVINNSQIIMVNQEESYIDIATCEDEKIRVYVDQNTIIRDTTGNIYLIEELEANYKIKVVTNGILTNSKPRETVGLELVVLEHE